jgi:hypothetical protein
MTLRSRRHFVIPLTASFALLLAACGEHASTADTTGGTSSSLEGSAKLVGVEDGATVLQRASIASIGTNAVALANGDVMQVDRAAATGLSRHRDFTGQLAAAGSALYGSVEVTEDFIETEHSVRLVATTRLTVLDPAALAAVSPVFGAFKFKGARSVPLSSLTVTERAWFDAYKLEMLAKPAKHPLGAAAREGSQALWTAIMAGKGDMSLTSYIEYPTGGLSLVGNTLQTPTVLDSYFDFSTLKARSVNTPGVLPTHDDEDNEPIGIDSVTESGLVTRVSEFVNGYGDYDAYNKGETWDLVLAKVHVGLHGDYAWGIRMPIQVTGSIDPAEIVHVGNTDDLASNFHTELSVDVFDADADFYEAAGVPNDEIQKGQELVANADAEVKIKISVFGNVVVDAELPKGNGFDVGEDFDPPFGECGTDCGFNVWIPPEATHTEVNFAGLAGANAQLGFNVSGSGEVSFDYQSIYDDEVVKSTSGEGDGKKTHRLFFGDAGDERNFRTDLARLRNPGTKSYGYKLSDLNYEWDFKLTPGVKATIWAGVKGFDWSDTIGPHFMDAFAINLGSMDFPTYQGSRASHQVTPGRKTWTDIEVNPNDIGEAEAP